MDLYTEKDPYPFDEHDGIDRRPREWNEPCAFPLDPLDISLARIEMARRIGHGPVFPEPVYTRSLWVAFAGEWGIWARAAIPLGDECDPANADRVARACTLAAELMGPPECHGFVIAAVVLRRPGLPEPHLADRKVFRLVGKAAAARETVPWSFYIASPEGFYPLGATVGK